MDTEIPTISTSEYATNAKLPRNYSEFQNKSTAKGYPSCMPGTNSMLRAMGNSIFAQHLGLGIHFR